MSCRVVDSSSSALVEGTGPITGENALLVGLIAPNHSTRIQRRCSIRTDR